MKSNIIYNMKKLYFAIVALLLCAISASAVTITPGTKLYLTPNSNWNESNARFAAYFYGNGEAWATMTDSNSDGIYECAVPNPGNFTHMIFVRLNPAGATPNWDNKWSQTIDLTWDGINNLYT